MPKARVLDLIVFLARGLRERNGSANDKAKMRLRAAVHAGEVVHDDNGVVGNDLNFACRLLDCKPLRAALASASGDLALIVSDLIYQGVVRHNAGLIAAEEYDEVEVQEKEVKTKAWITLGSRSKIRAEGSFAENDADQSRKAVRDGTTHQEPGTHSGVWFNAPARVDGYVAGRDMHVNHGAKGQGVRRREGDSAP